jgi:hypothetical protein
MILRKHADANNPKTASGAQNKPQIRAAMDWLLNNRSIEVLPMHGNTTWQPTATP